jgi:hypothetical protein
MQEDGHVTEADVVVLGAGIYIIGHGSSPLKASKN